MEHFYQYKHTKMEDLITDDELKEILINNNKLIAALANGDFDEFNYLMATFPYCREYYSVHIDKSIIDLHVEEAIKNNDNNKIRWIKWLHYTVVGYSPDKHYKYIIKAFSQNKYELVEPFLDFFRDNPSKLLDEALNFDIHVFRRLANYYKDWMIENAQYLQADMTSKLLYTDFVDDIKIKDKTLGEIIKNYRACQNIKEVYEMFINSSEIEKLYIFQCNILNIDAIMEEIIHCIELGDIKNVKNYYELLKSPHDKISRHKNYMKNLDLKILKFTFHNQPDYLIIISEIMLSIFNNEEIESLFDEVLDYENKKFIKQKFIEINNNKILHNHLQNLIYDDFDSFLKEYKFTSINNDINYIKTLIKTYPQKLKEFMKIFNANYWLSYENEFLYDDKEVDDVIKTINETIYQQESEVEKLLERTSNLKLFISAYEEPDSQLFEAAPGPVIITADAKSLTRASRIVNHVVPAEPQVVNRGRVNITFERNNIINHTSVTRAGIEIRTPLAEPTPHNTPTTEVYNHHNVRRVGMVRL